MGARQNDQAQFNKAISLFKEGKRPYAVAREIDINLGLPLLMIFKVKKPNN